MNDVELDLAVTFGKAWYKLVAASGIIGAAVAGAVYVTGRTMFKDCFKQTTLTMIKKEA